MAPTLVFLPAWRIPWTEDVLVGYSSWGHKGWDMTEQLTLSISVFRGEANVMRIVHSVCVSSHGPADPQRKVTFGDHLG